MTTSSPAPRSGRHASPSAARRTRAATPPHPQPASLLGRSRLGSVPAEGAYLRWDEGDWLVARAKIVRPGWMMASDEHWSAGVLKTNRLAGAAAHRVARRA